MLDYQVSSGVHVHCEFAGTFHAQFLPLIFILLKFIHILNCYYCTFLEAIPFSELVIS